MQIPSDFAYCTGLFVNGIEAQKRVLGRIAEMKMSMLSSEAFLRSVRAGHLKRLLFSRLAEECD